MTLLPGDLVRMKLLYNVYSEEGKTYYAVEGEPVISWKRFDEFYHQRLVVLVLHVPAKRRKRRDALDDYDKKIMVMCHGHVGWVFETWIEH